MCPQQTVLTIISIPKGPSCARQLAPPGSGPPAPTADVVAGRWNTEYSHPSTTDSGQQITSFSSDYPTRLRKGPTASSDQSKWLAVGSSVPLQ